MANAVATKMAGGGQGMNDKTPTGWYLYSNGQTRWGIGVWDGGKHFPKMITEEQNKLSIEDKIKLWVAHVEEIEKTKKDTAEGERAKT